MFSIQGPRKWCAQLALAWNVRTHKHTWDVVLSEPSKTVGGGIVLQYPGRLDTGRKSSDIRASGALGVLSVGRQFRKRASQIPNRTFLQSYPDHSPNEQINKVVNKL